jgi:hypothetical protein
MATMEVVADQYVYYHNRGITPGDAIRAPGIAPKLFDNFYAVEPSLSKRFLRACYWYNLGRFFFDF